MIRVLKWILKVFIGLLIFSVVWVFLYRWVNPPITWLHVSDQFSVEDCNYHYEWVDLNKISSHVPLAVISSEDNLFFEHNGFDWESIERARKYNETHKNKRGASTISQQTAKNVFLWPSRSWFRKGLEAYFTVLIEWMWPKERIMEVYLNVIEMGPCVYGVGAVSDLYFKTTPEKLTREQAALIASCLPNPKRFTLSKPTAYMQKRKSQIIRVMSCVGSDFFSKHLKKKEKEVEEKADEPIQSKLKKVREEDLVKPAEIESLEEEDVPDTTIQEIQTDTSSSR
jgi:monofunctional biosynthetic peptidoglycan transglycosylase